MKNSEAALEKMAKDLEKNVKAAQATGFGTKFVQ